MLVIGYFVFRAIMRASCGPRYYGQIPPPPPGHGPGYYGPGPGYGYGGSGPNYYGGGGMWNGLLGGLGGAWLGNEMFGQPTTTTAAPGTSVADPGSAVATYDEAGNAIDPSTSTSTGTPALGDGGGGSR